MTGDPKEYILQSRKNRAKVGDTNPAFGKAPDHFSHEIVPEPADGNPSVACNDLLDSWNAAKNLLGIGIIGLDDYRALGTMTADEILGRINVSNATSLDDRHPVAELLRLLHQVRGEKHSLSALPDASHQLPDSASRLRIETRRQLVEEHKLGIVDQRENDEEPLFLTSRQGHEPRISLVCETKLLEKLLPFGCLSIV